MGFTEMNVWKAPKDLATRIYKLTKSFPRNEQYELCKRLKNVAITAPDNIAKAIEGNYADDVRYYIGLAVKNYAELNSHLSVARELKFLDETTLLDIREDILSCKKLAYGYIRYHNNKYKDEGTEQGNIRSEAA